MKKNIILLVMILLTFSACRGLSSSVGEHTSHSYEENTDSEGENAKMDLTQRQQEILKQAGLTTEYEQLNENQKKAIVAIEEMFTYLDNKYEGSFEYVGYKAESNIDKETLIVQPTDITLADTVSVIREDGIFSDNYETVYYLEAYELMIKTFVEEKFSHVEVFSDIEEVKDVLVPNDLRPNVSASSAIYIAESDIEGDNFNEAIDEFSQWYAASTNGNACSFAFYLVPDDVYWSITRFNRTNYDDKVINKVNVIVRSDGTVVIK